MVRDEILEPNPTADLRVYLLWVPFLGGTEASIDVDLMPDARVLHFWDGERIASDFFGRQVFGGPGAWDVYLLYGPDARWGNAPEPLVSGGGTVVGLIDRIQRHITPLLTQA